jgi:ribonuclease T1
VYAKLLKRWIIPLVALLFCINAFARGPAPLGDVPVRDLPIEAQQTLVLIKQGGPFPYAKDGSVFGNYEKLLPERKRGYYREYTVKTPGARNRGARRIVSGGNSVASGEYYFTADHYASFRRVRE